MKVLWEIANIAGINSEDINWQDVVDGIKLMKRKAVAFDLLMEIIHTNRVLTSSMAG
jgi:hypothetical protein